MQPDLPIVTTIAEPAWTRTQAARDILRALEDQALFVGGCVRNTLIGKAVDDLDLATPLTPQLVTEKLEAANIRVVPTGIEHGTVTAVVSGQHFEITTLRKDVSTDGRRASVAFSTDWREDAMRRDFTINTLLADGAGRVYDPTGQGLEDLKAGRVVFVGEPEQRVAEDHLRILRFFRFFALYGSGAPDAEALKACAKAADKIEALSRERITQEFFKILLAPNADEILALMFANAIMNDYAGGDYNPEHLKHIAYFQSRYQLVSLPARLLALAGFSDAHMRSLLQKLLVPKVYQKDVNALQNILALPDLNTEQAVKVAVYKFGRTPAAQALMVELAQDRVPNAFAPAALKIIQSWDVPDFPVRGEDLLAQGYEKGPALGARLQTLEAQWIENGFRLPES